MNVILSVLFGAFVVYTAIRVFLAAFTQHPADHVRIRAKYEGLGSPVGPYGKVVSIERSGNFIGRRDIARRYLVAIRKLDGQVVQRVVYVDAGIPGGGEVWET